MKINLTCINEMQYEPDLTRYCDFLICNLYHFQILNREVQRQVRINALALFNEIVLNEAAENRGFQISIMEKSQMAKSLAEEFYVKDGFEPLVRKQLYYVQCWSLRK